MDAGTSPDVLIVGAGPTGLVLAVELARRGVAVRLIEAADEPLIASRGKGVSPRTQEIFDDMGIIGRIHATGRTELMMRMYKSKDEWQDHPIVEGAVRTPTVHYPSTMIIPAWRVEETLRHKLADLGVEVEFSTKAIEVTQDADQAHVTVERAGQTFRISAKHVIGTDGGQSVVRKQVGIGFAGETNDAVRMMLADVAVEGLHRDVWHVWPQPASGLIMTLCPLPATDSFQFSSALPPDMAGKELPLEYMQNLLNTQSGRTDIKLTGVYWSTHWRLNERLVERYREGRVLLAGDSAHVHSPYGGVGMNTSIQDAYNLGWKLAHVLAGAPEALLDTYEEERMQVAAHVLGFTGKLTKTGMISVFQGPAANSLQLNVNYRQNSLSAGDGRGDDDASPGSRAADAPIRINGEEPVRLHDLFRGPHLTVLGYGPVSAGIATRLADRYPGLVRGYAVTGDVQPDMVVDLDGHIAKAYNVTGDTVIIVRPDGYVGMQKAGASEQEALDYLGLLLPPAA